jgi:lysozyme
MTDLAQTLIESEEGRRRTVYKDNLGYDTIGIGCLVDSRVAGAGLCDAAIDAQFSYNSAQARTDAAALPGFAACNDVRQAVLISMCFQLGSLHDWPNFRAAIAAGDYIAAQAAGLASKWASETPERATRELLMLRTGIWIQSA